MIAQQSKLKWHECLDRIPADRELSGALIGAAGNGLADRLTDARDLLTVYHATGAAGALGFNDRSLDFVFIDDPKNYVETLQHLRSWRHRVKPGGWIGGRGYCDQFPGVRRAVDEMFGERAECGRDWTWFCRIE